MHDFDLHVPTTLHEATALLDQHGEDARLMAGGTGLVQLMKLRLSQPAHVVGLFRVSGLDAIEERNGELRIGALVTHRQLETSPLVQERVPLLVETYRHVATVRIRNAATIGGGLAHADPNQDPEPAFIALGARVVLTSSSGEREVAVEDLATDYYETVIEAGEVLSQVIVPIPPTGSGGAYLKFLPRSADDYATVSVAAWVALGSDGTCSDVHVALGSVGSTAVHANAAEAIVRGQRPTAELLRRAGEAVADVVDPLDDLRGSAEYKREMATVFTRRALEQAVTRAGGSVA
jgi:carbon-monoxide dehydrogenase medium subunit